MSINWTLKNSAPIKQKFKHSNKSSPYDKVCFGMGGQYGDVIMQEPGLRKFIEDNPNTKITLAICDKYKDVLPLFYNYHENIVEYKVWEGYDDWPTQRDLEYIESQNFDAMFPCEKPFHAQLDWARHRHIVTETAMMLGVEAETDDIQLKMPKEVTKEPKTVALHLFSSKYPGGTRSISVKKQTKIVAHLNEMGYKVYQLSSPDQPHIEGTIFKHGTYYDACLRMLSTDLLISCDSGMAWVASAYNHPTVALFSYAYNQDIGTTVNWHPVNPNATYFESFLANDIPLENIFEQIEIKLGKE